MFKKYNYVTPYHYHWSLRMTNEVHGQNSLKCIVSLYLLFNSFVGQKNHTFAVGTYLISQGVWFDETSTSSKKIGMLEIYR